MPGRTAVAGAGARALVVGFGVCVGLIVVELAWRVIDPPVTNEVRQFLLIGASGPGSAMQNAGPMFTYQPSSTIRVASYYDAANTALTKEFEYRLRTNNLGFVQTEDVEPGRPSALVLGDSFTEGRGAEPWFEQLAPVLREGGYQPINGGMSGTGFQQWMLLHDDLIARGMAIDKLIVILISDDYTRDVWNFAPNVLRCLSDYRACVGDEDYYGFPPEHARQAFLERLQRYQSGWPRLRGWFPATAFAVRRANRLVGDTWEMLSGDADDTPADAERRAAPIRQLAAKYGEDVIFVHLPTRPELESGIEQSGMTARAVVRESGATLFDGFEQCGMNAADFHTFDQHPNAAGYSKIAACVRHAAAEIAITAIRRGEESRSIRPQ